MSKINPDTLRDLFLAVMTGNPDFEYVNGEQPFVIKYKGQRYHIYMIKLTSAYFKSRPDTTRAQLNRRDRKSTRLNSSHIEESRMPSSA